MKKIILSFALVAGLFFTSNASESNYILDEQAVDQQISQATEVSFENAAADLSAFNQFATSSMVIKGGEQTKMGYLLRAFFCGGFGLHRSYMGTGGKSLWWFYLCVPVAGGVDACVDFWWVVFKGDEALNKYKDNSKFFVWAGN
ncbi:MAG: hypothetical protein ACXVC6_07630 [Bacteroidia bacterium]